MKVLIDEMRMRCEKVFQKAGVSEEDAVILTDVLLETEMRGVFTHGFYRVPNYVHCLQSGGIKPECDISAVVDTPSWALVDGNGGLGIVLSYKAMKLAMQKAKETGVGIVNLRNSHHFGAAGYYTGMCAEEKMAGMAMSNGDVLVAATGSRERTIGNNPFSFAVPIGKFEKMVYDIAMSYSSDKKIVKMAEEGKKLPLGWIIDKDGRDTTDPAEYEKGGTLLPFGGYKGYGMAMVVETLAAVLSGAAMTVNVHAWNEDPNSFGNVGHFFMALDIAKIYDVKEFEDRMESLIEQIKASPKAAGADEIYYPGEIELRKRRECIETGRLEIDEKTMEMFENVERALA